VVRVAPISVVIPTFRRPGALLRCLDGIANQDPVASEVICVVRPDDVSTREALADSSHASVVRVVEPTRSGLVGGLEGGAAAAGASIVAFIDDDAVPRPGWIAAIEATFASDGRIAGVGGRDWVYVDGALISVPQCRFLRRSTADLPVGRVAWTGRLRGNHHLGTGEPRDVDVLKGANMAFVRSRLLDVGFDPELRGSASQVHNELWPCLALKRMGCRLVYDPRIGVDHFVQPRPGADHREVWGVQAVFDATFNEARAVFRHRGLSGRLTALVWGLAVGTGRSPGLVQVARLKIRRSSNVWPRFLASAGARLSAYMSLRHAGGRRSHRSPLNRRGPAQREAPAKPDGPS